MKLGAHVSTAGGLDKAIDRGIEIGCEAIQLFASSPQSWAYKPVPESQIQSFREKASKAGLEPVFFHAIYLINLGAPNPSNVEKGVESLINYMKLAANVGAAGVIFHPGSHKGAGYEGIFRQTVSSIERVLANSPEASSGGSLQHPWLCLENTAGMGQHIGAKLEELGRIMKAVGSARLKVCLDTQHSFAAGYNIAAKDGLDAMLSEFDAHIGLSNLVAVHANDSKYPLGAGVDRHENIGQGLIGIEGFELIMAHSAFRDVPFFLEVPGFQNTGPDKENLDILKAIRARLS